MKEAIKKETSLNVVVSRIEKQASEDDNEDKNDDRQPLF